jgi:predicted site-specific integrase-resolvase
MAATCTPSQAAGLLGCSVSTVYRHVQGGRLQVRQREPITIEPEHLATVLRHSDIAARHSVDVATAARRLNMSTRAVFRRVYSGQLERYPMPHRAMRITRASLQRYMAQNAARAP